MSTIIRTLLLCLALLPQIPQRSLAQNPAPPPGAGGTPQARNAFPDWEHFRPLPPKPNPTEIEVKFTIINFVKAEAALAGLTLSCDQNLAIRFKNRAAEILAHWSSLTATPQINDPQFMRQVDATWALLMAAAAKWQRTEMPYDCKDVVAAAGRSVIWSLDPAGHGLAGPPPAAGGPSGNGMPQPIQVQ